MGKRPSEHADFLTRQQRRFRNARRWVFGQIARPTTWLLQRTPLPVLRAMSRIPSWISYWSYRKRADEQLAFAFGDRFTAKERRVLAKRSCHNLAAAMAEALRATHVGATAAVGPIDDEVARPTLEAFDRKDQRGWIALTGHIGNWEILTCWLKSVIDREELPVFAKRLPNPHVNRIVENLRTQLGACTIYQDDSPAPAIRSLRNGNVVGVVPDQDVKSLSGMFVDFFGRPAYTPVGPARIAIAARVPIIPLFLLRGAPGFRLELGEPIYPDQTLSREAQISQVTNAWSQAIERTIRENPDQWPWIHSRWKTTPEKLEARGRRRLSASPDQPPNCSEAM